MSDKYSALTEYLNGVFSDQITLTFSQVANIIGGLPPSAYIYPAWWANGAHTYSFSWLNAGFKTSLDITNRKVTFFKAESPKIKQSGMAAGHSKSSLITSQSKTVPLLDIHTALQKIRKYYDTTGETSTRYRSWEHCYKAFQANRDQSDRFDLLCLHLAVYLASWGMLRNSFLLDYDYLIHITVVETLTSGRYEKLFADAKTAETVPLVMQASEEIRKSYLPNKASDTLVTKILLGVFGCAPAYDQYFRAAARKYKVCSGEWGIASLQQLWDFYQTNYALFENLQCEITFDGGSTYPPMKLMDMCLWQIGFDEEADTSKEA